MSNLYVHEAYVNRDTDVHFDDSDVYETRFADVGDLYRSCVKEWGRCTGSIRTEPSEKRVGWVFVKRVPYEDNLKKTYLREVWVTVYASAPTKATKHHYAELGE